MSKVVLSIGQCGFDSGQIDSLLRSLSVAVRTASTAAAARKLLEQEAIDLVLVNRVFDVDGDSGLEFIRSLKGDDKFSEIPLMLVSNYADAQAQAVDLGALPGFGKQALRSSSTQELLRQALQT